MPIPNDQFRPPVVCNRFHNEQIAAWINDRPVPTLEELGAKPPTSRYVPPVVVTQDRPHSPLAAVQAVVIETDSGDGSTIRTTVKTPKFTTPETKTAIRIVPNPEAYGNKFEVLPIDSPRLMGNSPAAIKRPPAIIGAPTRILPPPKKRA